MQITLSTALIFAISTSFAKDQCCIDPVKSFRLNSWSGPCSAQTITQKWNRYKDWIQLNNGYIHPYITFDFVDGSDTSNRGIFPTQDKHIIQSQSILMQIPFSISLTQFTISKYIQNSTNIQLFGAKLPTTQRIFLPKEFPDYDTFLLELKQHHSHFKGDFNLLSPNIAVWMALGLSWIKQNTNELLPWINLLPSAYYLPFLFQNKEYLFKDTEIEILLNAMEYDFMLAYKYLNILHISEQTVRELYALLYSRLFQIDFSHIGGLQSSPAIPCGADFFNHDSSVMSEFPFYDELFGDHFYANTDKKNNVYHHMSYIIPKMVEFIGKEKVRKTDFMSSYYFVKYPIYPKKEIFGSYGGNHPSHVSMGLYGFMEDKIDTNDYINIMFRNYNDEKYQYFDQKKTLSLMFHFGSKQLRFAKDVKLSKDFQLLYLPIKYMDSFTISSIINGFEWKYISNIIGPIIEREIKWFCYDKLMYLYPTQIKQDHNDLSMIKKHLQYIKSKLNDDKKINLSRHRKEKLRLQSILKQTQTQLTITKYTIREKQFFIKCTNVNTLYA